MPRRVNQPHYVSAKVVQETADIGQISTADTHLMSASLHTAIEYVTYTAVRDHKLRNGQTALFWHLVAVVNQHLVAKEAPA